MEHTAWHEIADGLAQDRQISSSGNPRSLRHRARPNGTHTLGNPRPRSRTRPAVRPPHAGHRLDAGSGEGLTPTGPGRSHWVGADGWIGEWRPGPPRRRPVCAARDGLGYWGIPRPVRGQADEWPSASMCDPSQIPTMRAVVPPVSRCQTGPPESPGMVGAIAVVAYWLPTSKATSHRTLPVHAATAIGANPQLHKHVDTLVWRCDLTPRPISPPGR